MFFVPKTDVDGPKRKTLWIFFVLKAWEPKLRAFYLYSVRTHIPKAGESKSATVLLENFQGALRAPNHDKKVAQPSTLVARID